MKQHHRTTRRLATAVAAILAVTAGGMTVPAFAAGPAVPTVSAQATAETVAPLTVPADSVLVSAGRTGILTSTGRYDETVYRWTRLSDGVTTQLPAGPHWGSPGTDLVGSLSGSVYTLTDMSGTREPVVIDLSGLDASGTTEGVRRIVGTTLVVLRRVNGRLENHLVSLADGRLVDHRIDTPLNAYTTYDDTYDAGPGLLVTAYSPQEPGSSSRLAVVDVATGALTETYDYRSALLSSGVRHVALTGDRLTWIDESRPPTLTSVVRGTQDVERVVLNNASADGYTDTAIRTLGDWALYSRPGGGDALYPDPLHALTARPLAGGDSYPLLDHMSSSAYDADGGLLVLGGTLAQGEGLYRIALDPATGRPAATLLRSLGRPTALTVLEEQPPPSGTIDFDRAGGQLRPSWTFSRSNAVSKLTLTHTASGRSVDVPGVDHAAYAPFPWNGRFADGLPAYNGAYTWKMTATPANGIGPTVTRTGTFTLKRAPRPHDFDGNGSPDLLVRSFGSLSMFDAGQARTLGSWQDVTETRIGAGWDTYDRIAATGNLGGTAAGDLVARDRTGVLWFYEGKAAPKTPFGTRIRVGAGWQVYDKLAGGSDLTGDGRNDLLATDKTGVLWLYPGTGSATKPFACGSTSARATAPSHPGRRSAAAGGRSRPSSAPVTWTATAGSTSSRTRSPPAPIPSCTSTAAPAGGRPPSPPPRPLSPATRTGPATSSDRHRAVASHLIPRKQTPPVIPQGRTTRRRLSAAVATALAMAAVTAATAPVLVSPAVAAVPAASTSDVPATPLPVPSGTTVLAAGPSGFLTSRPEGTATVHTWIRTDGTQVRLPAGRYAGNQGTDLVVRVDGAKHTYLDLSEGTGTEVVSYETTSFTGTPAVLLHQGTRLVTRTFPTSTAGPELHIVGKDAEGRNVDRAVPGVPADELVGIESAGPDTLLVRYYANTGGVRSQRLSVVDVASASVVETYDHVYGRDTVLPAAASAAHLAWLEPATAPYPTVLATARRGEPQISRTDLPLPGDAETTGRLTVRVVGDWVVYAALGGGTAPRTEALHEVTARSLTTGATVPLLAHASALVSAPDGALLASGGTLAQGEGVYRIAPGATDDAPPAVTLQATTGISTALTLTTENAPAGTVDLDRAGGTLKPSWTLNRHNAEVRLTVRHTATGRSWNSPALAPRPSAQPFAFTWNGSFDGKYPAFNGAYTWTMTAKPANGIGPALVRTGSFTVTRAVRPHDFDDNGSPDLLVRDAQGRLALYEGRQYLASRRETDPPSLPPTPLGTGWNAYDRITATGDLGGARHGDLLGRDTTGVLWLHQGNGKGLAPRVRIGGGWQVYDQLAAGPDLTGDGRNDLLATDKTGVLWLYPGTGSATKPFGTPDEDRPQLEQLPGADRHRRRVPARRHRRPGRHVHERVLAPVRRHRGLARALHLPPGRRLADPAPLRPPHRRLLTTSPSSGASMRFTPRRLATAAAVALAVTAGVLTAPAVAAGLPVAAAGSGESTGTQQEVPVIQDGGTLYGSGTSGFLTWHSTDGVSSSVWTRYADGSTTALPHGTGPHRPLRGTDVVVKVDGLVHTFLDMGTDAEPVVMDLGTLGPGYQAGYPVGPAALVTLWSDPSGREEVRLVTATAEGLRAKPVTGLPAGADITSLSAPSPGTVLVRYADPAEATATSRIALVDTARAERVVDVAPAHPTGSVAVSPTHLAWVEQPTSSTATVVVMDRGATPATALRIPLTKASGVKVQLIDGWVLYGQGGHDLSYATPNPLYGVTARSLTGATSLKLLDTYTAATAGPDSTVLVQGGTLAAGEGMYRIAPGPDGIPVAQQVASTGRSTAVTLLSSDVPAVLDFDKQNPALLSWHLADIDVAAAVTLTHVATGQSVQHRLYSDHGITELTWGGEVADRVPGYNGAWTWRLTAKPNNGIGPTLDVTGSFRVQRAAVPHDFDDNGLPDVLSLSENGTFTRNTVVGAGPTTAWTALYHPSNVLGTGWHVYDRIVPTANVGGNAHADILTRDRAGVLWLHQGTGTGLAHRVKVGGGWQIYDQLTSAADLTGDGRTDLVATDKAGVLWLYKGTGDAAKPFAPRTRVGGGWNTYDKIAAVGNLAGAPAGDLVARDRDGALWLYLGKGDGTFAARTRIGGGWGGFTQIIGVGDQNRDGRGDLMAVDGQTHPSLYRGTGDWRKPLAARQHMYDYYLPHGVYY
nr:FG-GAP-like repeat-containing protein [Streptomyces sp. NRRL F-5727]